LVDAARVRRFAPEESKIYLERPPFHTVADELASASPVAVEAFWKRHAALHQIVPELALIIGDFGLGSDAPIILNFAIDQTDPPVFRLRWGPDGRTQWVQGASSVAEFVNVLGLTDGGV
jgi:hypothetical protein